MYYLLAASLLFLGFHPASARANERTNNREIIRQVSTNLNALIDGGKLARRDLTITVDHGHVTVTGRIEDAQESRLILESVITAGKISGIELNLGIGREPASAVQPTRKPDCGSRPLHWDDGDWQLDFGTKPSHHRTKP